MRSIETSAVSRRIVDDVIGVDATEDVVVLTDTGKLDIAETIAAACRATGATTVVEIMPRTDEHGNEAPDTVIAAMTAADVVFTATTNSITHTDGFRNALESGARTAVFRGVTEDMFVAGGIDTDYERLRERTLAVREALDAASEATVRSPAGTDVTLDLRGQPAFSLDGYCHEHNDNLGAYPAGESPTSPASGTGTIVIDYSMDGIGRLDDPIELTLEDGDVTAVSGGREADELRETIEGADAGARNLAEFAIGTNPDARLVGNLAEDKKRLGTIHFAIGDDRTLAGETRSSIHLDGLVRKPTVELDGTRILDAGDLRRDRLDDVTGRDE
ncbi:aminopeptidase [Halopenitus sp. POP-27]|uniref:aminopeptidase n=1 Tax=Halopenitus sp. POP-27 TaxID=2994425 RepID=UPI0024691E1B|nr:aminopeptidase [Halopenitus sp. POP-27]